MLPRVLAVLLLLVAASLASAVGTSDAPQAVPLAASPPAWYTPALHAQVLAAAEEGLALELATGQAVAAPPVVVQPGEWMVSPSSCTLGFVHGAPGSYTVSTSGACVDAVGDPVVVLVAPQILVAVGRVASFTDAGPGKTFAVVSIFSQWQARVDPCVPAFGGPVPGPAPSPGALLAFTFQDGLHPSAGILAGYGSGTFSMYAALSAGAGGAPVLGLEGRVPVGILTHGGGYQNPVVVGQVVTDVTPCP